MTDEEQLPPTVETEETTKTLRPREDLSQSIPGFRFVQKLGEGGMGEVFEAEQLEPVRRKVALKLIKRGMESKEVLARFDSERQALALMSHPNIAQVYDAGTTEDGRPYFVMEFVAGVPVTEYCDRNRLGTRDRLDLFIQICDGVQHAHHKGVIHRDIKPSNVLVKIQDSKPVPKIIDFGIAKATSQRLTEQSVFTAMGEFIGTPEYMSPEQADLTGLDVDTRTDVYSLGVVLYEMLVGAQPFDGAELRRAGFDEMRRRIREDEPPRPSTRLSGLGEQPTKAAENRRSEPSTLARQLHGDLDWITMKALEKDRTRRYDSPGELAADIGRHLRDEPVMAGPPSATYRVKKFVRRHTVGVAASSLVIVALILGIAGTTTGMIRARNAEQAASREAETAKQVSDFLVGLFKVSDPTEGSFEKVTAREMLDKGAERIRRELTDQPLVQARLMSTIGDVYIGLGIYEPAQELLEEALAIREAELPPDNPDVAESLNLLGEVYREKAEWDEAWPLYERALAIYEEGLGPESQEAGMVLTNMALVLVSKGEYDEALKLQDRVLAINLKIFGPDDPVYVGKLTNVALLHARMGNLDEAKSLFEQTLEAQEAMYGPDHIRVARGLNNVGAVLQDMGEYEAALALYERSLAIKEKVLEPDHPELAGMLSNIGSVLRKMGDPERARPYLEQSVAVYRKAFRHDDPRVAEPLSNLGFVNMSTGRPDEGRPMLEEALAIRENALGPDHPYVAVSLNNLGFFYYTVEDYGAALTYYERTLLAYESLYRPNHPEIASVLRYMVNIHLGMGDMVKAREKLEWIVRIGDGTSDIWYNLACLWALAGDDSSALDALQGAVESGFTDVGAIESDPDLESLRGTERFQAIVRQLRVSDPAG